MPFNFASLTMIQNEADVIEHFVRANLRFMDHMFIVSNPSSDGTGEILEKLVFEKLSITVWKANINNYTQGEIFSWFTLYLREALRPKFLLLLDADEFILSASKASMIDAFSLLPANQVGKLNWVTFVPPKFSITENPRSVDFVERLERETHRFSKPVIPSTVEIHPIKPLTHGLHTVIDPQGNMLLGEDLLGVELAHLPVRSINQLREKAAATPLARALSHGTEWKGAESYQYAQAWEQLKLGSSQTARDIAIGYLNQGESTSQGNTVYDDRLHANAPDLVYTISQPSQNELYFQLVDRLLNTAFMSRDPVQPLKQALKMRIERVDQAREDLPPGAFSVAQHEESLKCDWPPIEQMILRFSPKRLLDLGCGLGAYLYLAKLGGVAVTGVDGSPWTHLHFLDEGEYLQHDLSIGPPNIEGNFDTSMCIELLEHLPEGPGLEIVDWLSRETTQTIVFSAARPGQPGHQHITCREPSFWLHRFLKNGWKVDAAATASLRLLSSLHWLRCNIFVLQKEIICDHEGVGHILSLPYPTENWPSQGQGRKLIGFPGIEQRFNLDGSPFLAHLPVRAPSSIDALAQKELIATRAKIRETQEIVLERDSRIRQLEGELASLKEDLIEAATRIKMAHAFTLERDSRMRLLEGDLARCISESSARRSRLAERIDELDYRLHLSLSRISPTRAMRIKFANAARRRFRERYKRK